MPRRSREVQQAAKLYTDFRGEDAEFVDTIRIDTPNVLLLVGECDGLLYTTRRDGKIESYIHRFRKASRPLLTASASGKSLHLVGGRYRFTDAGIIDL